MGNQFDNRKCNASKIARVDVLVQARKMLARAPNLPETMPVGSYLSDSSPYGVMDMAGNVAEWCADWFSPDSDKRSPARDPQGPPSGKERVVRGCCWNGTGDPRVFYRARFSPTRFYDFAGFRCALSGSGE